MKTLPDCLRCDLSFAWFVLFILYIYMYRPILLQGCLRPLLGWATAIPPPLLLPRELARPTAPTPVWAKVQDSRPWLSTNPTHPCTYSRSYLCIPNTYTTCHTNFFVFFIYLYFFHFFHILFVCILYAKVKRQLCRTFQIENKSLGFCSLISVLDHTGWTQLTNGLFWIIYKKNLVMPASLCLAHRSVPGTIYVPLFWNFERKLSRKCPLVYRQVFL